MTNSHGAIISRHYSNMTIPLSTCSVVYPTPILVLQINYLDNVVKQDHRAIKCVTRGMLGSNRSGPPASSR